MCYAPNMGDMKRGVKFCRKVGGGASELGPGEAPPFRDLKKMHGFL